MNYIICIKSDVNPLWTGLRPYCPCLGIHCWLTELPLNGSLPLNSNDSSSLHRGTVKGSEHDGELQTCKEPNPFFTAAWRLKHLTNTQGLETAL